MIVGIKLELACLGFLNTSQIGGYFQTFLFFFAVLFLFVIIIIFGGRFLFAMVLAQRWRLTFWTFTNEKKKKNCLLKRLVTKTPPSPSQGCNVTIIKTCKCFWEIFIFVFGHYWRTAHTRRTFCHFYHLKKKIKIGGHTEHKQLKRNVTRTLFLYIKDNFSALSGYEWQLLWCKNLVVLCVF